MVSVHREVEDKFEADDDAELPRLDRLPGVATVHPPVEVELYATYFDTAELALAAAGITVRRRTGGDDAGWHLKLPDGNGHRDELRVPLGRAARTVPKPLRTVVRALSRDRPLAAVATVRTRRCVHRLLDVDGRVLAEVCDDTVSASTPASGDAGGEVRWREWEVELVDGNPTLLVAAGRLLQDVGSSPSTQSSKLARVLGDRVPQNGVVGQPRLKPGVSAGEVVLRRLREQVAEVKLRDPHARRDAADGVHKMLVALRRLRSALATFGPLLDREVTDPLRAELKWVATALGAARDAEVLQDKLSAAIRAESKGLVLGPVSARVQAELRGAYKHARQSALETLDSDRYLAALDGLDRLVADPPWTAKAHRPGYEVLPKRMRREWKRLGRRVDEAERAGDQAQRDNLLHEARKAAKRTRYAAETLVPVYRRDAERLATGVKKVQTVLGHHHDSVLAQPVLREMAVKAHKDGDSAFSYGRLHRQEQARAEAAAARFAKTWKKASRPKLRSWLR